MRWVSQSLSRSEGWFGLGGRPVGSWSCHLLTVAFQALVFALPCPLGIPPAAVADGTETQRPAAGTTETYRPAADTSAVLALEDVLESCLGLAMDENLFERLIWLRDHPIDLNAADTDVLLSVPGVSSAEVDAIQRYRRKHGQFRETFDLAGIEGVTARTWELFRPFVTVSPRRRALLGLRARAIWPLEAGSGDDGTTLGSADALYTRLTLSPCSGWEAGLVFLADRGERLKDGFLSGFVQYESAGMLRHVIVGDFIATGGLGLLWGQAMRRDASLVGTLSGHFSPHRSSGEQGFVRGIGATLALPFARYEARLHVLASYTPCSATIDSTDEIISLAQGGAFSTSSTLQRRNAGHFSSLGGRLELLAPGNLHLGLTAQKTRFDYSIHADRLFEMSGEEFDSFGADGMARVGPVRCATEYAVATGGRGVSASIDINVGRDCASRVLFRRCDPGFHSLLALGGDYGEATRNRSEVRWSLEVSPFRDSYVQWDLVQYRMLWRTATELFPVGGRELSVESGLRPAKGFQLTLRGEERWTEHSVRTVSGVRPVVVIANEPYRRLQCTGNFTRGAQLHIRGRIEGLRFLNPVTGSDENGWMASGDAHWEPMPWLAVSARMTIFQSDAYDSRLYSIESNVDGLSGSKLLTGTGRRWYCLLVCRPSPSLRVSARFASTERLLGACRRDGESQLILQVDFQMDPPLE